MPQYIVLSKTNPHLPHDSVELQSPPPPDALTDEIAQKNAELIIGRMVCEYDTAPPPAALRAPAIKSPTAAPAHPAPAACAVPVPEAAAPANGPARAGTRARKGTPCATPAAEDVEVARLRAALTAGDEFGQGGACRSGGLARWGRAGLILAALVLAAALWPVPVAAAALLIVTVAIAATLLVRRAVPHGRWGHLARRHPRTAARLGRVCDRIAVGMDVVLDLLPPALADRLAWPDLSQPLSARSG